MRAGRGGRAGVAFATCLLAAGCGRGESSKVAASSPDAGPVFHIVATSHGFEYPSSIPSGMTHIVFENRDTTIHETQFMKLAPGMSGADYVKREKSGEDFPEGAVDCAGPGLMSPGERVEHWTRLEPGRYFIACWYRGHLESPPYPEFTVTTDSTTGVTPPKPDATVRLADFEFQLADSIARGERTIRVEMLGPSMHEMDIFQLLDGKTIEDIRAWRKNHQKGEPPVRGMGGVDDETNFGNAVVMRRAFTPGRYVLWCGMPMVTSGGNPGGMVHSDAGMVREFEVR